MIFLNRYHLSLLELLNYYLTLFISCDRFFILCQFKFQRNETTDEVIFLTDGKKGDNFMILCVVRILLFVS